MNIKKAIIPVAGWGTRRLPITKVIEKSMLPIGNRPLVDYVVEDCIKAGIKDIYFVISSQEPSQIKAYYSHNQSLEKYLTERGKSDRLPQLITVPEDVNFHYCVQNDDGRYGTAIPVAQAVKDFNITESVAILMGDDFIWNADGSSDIASLVKTIQSDTDSAILGTNVPRSEVEKYGVLKISDDNHLIEIVEKPKASEAPSNLINISKYIASPALLKHIVDYVDNNNFGSLDQEYYITDPIFTYLNSGGIMHVLPATGQYLDGGTLEGWLHANNVVCG